MIPENELYWVWLSSVDGLSASQFYRLLSWYDDPREVWLNRNELTDCGISPAMAQRIALCADDGYLDTLVTSIERAGARAVTLIGEGYPRCLQSIPLAPPVLYVRGSASLDSGKSFSIVGTRRPSRTGMRAAREIACGLAREGVTVVSGLAYGIDACAHRGALDGNGPTIAVLGNSIDKLLPRENEKLGYEILEKGGAVVSEYAPGAGYYRSNYPMRNRVISGLSDGVLLVEGTLSSGGMITVNRAMEQNRDVFAVPGDLYIPQSEAPNRLLYDGAQPVLCADDILEYYRWAERKSRGKLREAPAPELSEEEKPVYAQLKRERMSVGELCRALGLPAEKLLPTLTLMEFEGLVMKENGEYILR